MTAANLDNAEGRNINLSRSTLALASLNRTNLENAHLYRTDVRGVDLTNTIGLTQIQLSGACGDSETKLPKGLRPPVGHAVTRIPINSPLMSILLQRDVSIL